jgi:hypothetical protein
MNSKPACRPFPSRLVFFFAVASLALLQQAGLAAEYQARVHTNAAGQTIPYRLLVPRNYDPATLAIDSSWR